MRWPGSGPPAFSAVNGPATSSSLSSVSKPVSKAIVGQARLGPARLAEARPARLLRHLRQVQGALGYSTGKGLSRSP
jgi:hypothetical protein